MARKIFTGALIGISSILLVLSLVGIGAAWVYNEPLTQKAIARLQEIDTELAQTQTALENTKMELDRTLRIVDAAQGTLEALSRQVGDAKQLLDEVDNTLQGTLIPGLKASREKINGMRGTLEDLRNTLKELNNVPFVDLNLPGDELLTDLISSVDSLDSEIVGVEDLAQKASTFTSDAAYLLGGDLTETKQHLEDLLEVVENYQQQVTDWRAQIKTLLESLPGWIDRASIILTVFLLWFGFSQFGLLLHGLSLWKGGDPLAVLRRA